MKYLELDDIIDNEKYKGKTVKEILESDRKKLISLCKEGYNFSDNVLKFARYTRTIRDEKIYFEFIDRSKTPVKNKKTLMKDSESNVKKILKELAVLDQSNNYYDEDIDSEIEDKIIDNE